MNTPWVKEKWHVSLYNFTPEVREQMNLPKKILISDCTLREGEQHPGIVFGKEDKLRLAHALDEIGIPEIEVGTPAVSPEERESIKAIVKAGLKTQVRVVCRAMQSDIDMAIDCGVSLISLSLPVGNIQLDYKLKWPEEKVVEKAREIIDYAHHQGLRIVISPMDAPRTNPDFLERYLRTIAATGYVERVRLVDTVGSATPLAIKYLVRKMADITHLPIEVHCHNDFGLGTANCLAGIEAGAAVASTSLNGMAERTGLAATEEVTLALHILYGIDSGLKYENFYQASLLLQELSNLRVQKHKPVVGENAFAQESGLVVTGWIANPFTAVPYLPEVVGQRAKLVLGKGSGKDSIRWKLKQLGISATDEQVVIMMARVKEVAERTKSAVSDEVFKEICHQTTGKGYVQS